MSDEKCIIFRNNFMTVSEINPIILLNGETAIEIDNDEKVVRIKIGNNISTYSELPFYKVGYSDNIIDIINEALSHYNIGAQSISISGGSENGTIKLKIDNSEYDNIKVTGLGSAAYTAISNYATSEQGIKADNAMPKTGGRFTGSVYLNNDPVDDYEASTKHYVDLKTSIKADSVVYKGTIGNNGTLREIPYLNVNSGDTYRIVSPLTFNNNRLNIGDLIVAKVNGPSILWEVIPSNITTIKLSSTDVNVNNIEKSGSVVLGYAASKQVATDINTGSDDLVTAKQVKDYNTVTEKTHDVKINNLKHRYALLPVWILNTVWNGNKYTFAMNGQTGKLVGNVPCSMGKFWGILLGAGGGLGLLMFLLAHAIGVTGAGMGFMIFMGVLIGVIIALVMKGKTTSVHQGTQALDYVIPGSFKVTAQYDNFLRKETKKKKKNKQ